MLYLYLSNLYNNTQQINLFNLIPITCYLQFLSSVLSILSIRYVYLSYHDDSIDYIDVPSSSLFHYTLSIGLHHLYYFSSFHITSTKTIELLVPLLAASTSHVHEYQPNWNSHLLQ